MPGDLPDWTDSVATPQVELGELAQPVAPGGAVSGTFPVPAGTHAIALLFQRDSDFSGQVNVTGDQSGAHYVDQVIGFTAGMFLVPFGSAIDASVTVLLTAGPTRAGAKAYVLAILDVEAIQVYGGFPFTQAPVVQQGIGSGPTLDAWLVRQAPMRTDASAVTEAAAGVQAIATVAGVAGFWHVIKSGKASIAAGGAAPGAAAVRYQVLDGAALIHSQTAAVQAVAGHTPPPMDNVEGLSGSTGNAMTVQCSAGVANTFESASLATYRQQ